MTRSHAVIWVFLKTLLHWLGLSPSYLAQRSKLKPLETLLLCVSLQVPRELTLMVSDSNSNSVSSCTITWTKRPKHSYLCMRWHLTKSILHLLHHTAIQKLAQVSWKHRKASRGSNCSSSMFGNSATLSQRNLRSFHLMPSRQLIAKIVRWLLLNEKGTNHS